MDGNFLSRYENKVNELSADPNRMSELCDYILECVPFLEKYMGEGNGKTEKSVFSTDIKKGVQRKEIYNEYLRKVERYNGKLDIPPLMKKIDTNICKLCSRSTLRIDYIQSASICTSCGSTEYIQIQELSYKEEQETSEKVIVYSYKRDNHFNEWLLQFQAQEKTNIPDEVIIQLRSEFKKQKIKTLSEITQSKVRTLLKKLKMNKYYEHVPYITNILNGVDPPKMSQELEDKLRQLFREIQLPFIRHCPVNRTNFLSYSYVLYKFCELLGEDDFLGCFPLLKSKEKLHQQDMIWKNICKDLRWEYIPTI
jgi:hypothetical protein